LIPSFLRHSTPPAALVIAIAAIFWGLWWLPLRLLEAGSGVLQPVGLNAWLYGIVALVCLPVLYGRRHRIAANMAAVTAAAVVFGAAILAWNLALLQGEVVRVTLLFYLSPIWGSVLGWLLLSERIGPARLLALPLGLCGAVVLLGGGGSGNGGDGWSWPLPSSTGDWYGLGSGVLFALSAALARRFRLDGVSYTALSFVACAAMAVPMALVFEDGIAVPEPAHLVTIGVLGLVWMLPVTFGLLWGSSQIDPGRLSLLMLLEVVAAAVSASLLTDEAFGLREAAGCALILGAGLIEVRAVPPPHDTPRDPPD
jgi:drug/metabolite transporter (DMT)-like permease